MIIGRHLARWASGFAPMWLDAILLAYKTLNEEVR